MEDQPLYSKKSKDCIHLRDRSLFHIGDILINKQSIFINIQLLVL